MIISMYFLDIVIAIIIDCLIGDPYWFPHPVIYIGKFISFMEKVGRKLTKNNKKLRLWGGVIVITISLVSFFIPFGLLYFTRNYFLVHHSINIIMLWTTIAAKCLKTECMKVYYALKEDDIDKARLLLSYLVGRETSSLNKKEITRADVETLAENTSDGVIAPLFYALIGGAPLAMLYKGINTMDSMLGYMNEKYRYLGFFPAKTDDVFNYIPARITGLLMCLCAPLVKGNIFNSMKIMFRDRKNHKSPNCAYPEGAAAGAMRIQIGGTNIYFGEIIYKPTIGDKIVELSEEHIKETCKLMYGSMVLLMVISGILIISGIIIIGN